MEANTEYHIDKKRKYLHVSKLSDKTLLSRNDSVNKRQRIKLNVSNKKMNWNWYSKCMEAWKEKN